MRGVWGDVYSREIVDSWAPLSISSERIEALSRCIERGAEVIFAAEDEAGHVIGFGAIVPGNSELRALYVSAEVGRKGVGRAILSRLEARARQAGLSELRLDASLNAAPFYEANGYVALQRGEHTLPSGTRMASVRMRKALL